MLAGESSLLMQDCTVQKGPNATDKRAAIMLPDSSAASLVFRRNRFFNDTGAPVAFILNWTGATPVLDGNAIPQGDEEVSSSGAFRHWAGESYRGLKDEARHLIGDALRLARAVARGL
jgi:hypothetical protein